MKSALLSILLTMTLVFFGGGSFAYAQTEAEQLQQQISEERNRLKEIDAEIEAYRAKLQEVGAEKSTLQSALNRLDIERDKVLSDIAYTRKRIEVTDLEINKLSGEIENTKNSIDIQRRGIAETIRSLHVADQTSPIVTFLAHSSIGDFWLALDQLAQVRTEVGNMAEELASYQVALAERREEESDKRSELLALSMQYEDQNEVLENTAAEKSTLLAQTRSKESEYQKLLREKREARARIEAEMREYESRLQFILDPNTIPPAGTPVFAWPIASPIITQYFGGTEFAKNNSSIYAGRAYHPGIDIGASRGTKIYAPYDGVVRATGNTDSAPGCWAWGKWTLIDHPNGLATLYAHQNQHGVSPGDTVKKGEVVGYVGNTGYSTGPHLHFTVYAKAAVEVRTYGSTACASVPRPTAPTSAYIDPMTYLPAL